MGHKYQGRWRDKGLMGTGEGDETEEISDWRSFPAGVGLPPLGRKGGGEPKEGLEKPKSTGMSCAKSPSHGIAVKCAGERKKCKGA